MFHAETEDLLPRAAPKPSAPVELSEPTVKPIVPEVSILFGAQLPATSTNGTTTGTAVPTQQKLTYADWKKKHLPKITSPSANSVPNNDNSGLSSAQTMEYATARSPLYPMRTTTVAAAPLTTQMVPSSIGTARSVVNGVQYRRNDDNVIGSVHSLPTKMEYCDPNTAYQQLQQQLAQQHRRSLDALSQLSGPSTHADVLTICAGTQTESSTFSNSDILSKELLTQSLQNVATKQDLEKIMETLHEMRELQLHTVNICETLLMQHQQQQLQQQQQQQQEKKQQMQHQKHQEQQPHTGKTNTPCRNTGIQCNIDSSEKAHNSASGKPIIRECYNPSTSNNERPCSNGHNVMQPLANNFYHQLKITTPQQPIQQTHEAPPMMPLTKCRSNSPVLYNGRYNHHIQKQSHQQANIGGNVIPKAATEKSMAMTELALKYLPNEKLNEILHELHMPTPQPLIEVATPLCSIENFDKGSGELSNASYKYLKKYRLLPESADYQQRRHNQHLASPGGGEGRMGNGGECVNLNNIKPPLATGQQQMSPYARPIAYLGIPENDSDLEHQMLDLEAIRQQPKFL